LFCGAGDETSIMLLCSGTAPSLRIGVGWMRGCWPLYTTLVVPGAGAAAEE
jgi:hypothetical protein